MMRLTSSIVIVLLSDVEGVFHIRGFARDSAFDQVCNKDCRSCSSYPCANSGYLVQYDEWLYRDIIIGSPRLTIKSEYMLCQEYHGYAYEHKPELDHGCSFMIHPTSYQGKQIVQKAYEAKCYHSHDK